jgi:hypothetical protein
MTRVRQHSRLSFIDIVARLWAAVQIAVLLSCFVPRKDLELMTSKVT